MCDSQTPYDKILRLAEAFLAERFPAHADKIKAFEAQRLATKPWLAQTMSA